ncbi:hypothetical protein HA630_01125, partial [Aquabacterium sp. A08]|nr:hypothetical protein [Aquabacterium sp. A08]NIC39666.1 hypothetical protein [Aquabacterium sp. A08]
GDTPGWGFQLALEVVAALHAERQAQRAGLTPAALAQALKVDPLQLAGSVETLLALGWVGQLAGDEAPLVLLVDPAAVPLAP